jgi:tetraacyldisaccharide 4'-kinase
MSEPWFWRGATPAARLMRAALLPAAVLYDVGQQLRWRLTAPVDAGVPVICVGNASVGGTGKTPFAMMLQRLLAAEGVEAHFLTRGYGGSLRGPVKVDAQHTVEETGDEAPLLARVAPCWIAKDRAAGARAAAAAGAPAIIMDDGFQNPSVRKTLSFLLLGGDENGLAPFPAGPMREPLARAIGRADAAVVSAPLSRSQESEAPPRFGVIAEIEASIPPQPVLAFCGIGRPARFFDALEADGFALAGRETFPDHHPYTAPELARLRNRADKANAALITTEKDLVRLAPADREGVAVARLTLRADDPAALVRFVLDRIAP